MTVNDIIDSATAEERFASAEINSESVVYVRGDLTKSDDVTRLVQTARDRNGPMHIALCHVGMAGNSPLLEVTEQDWDRMMAVNTKTAFLLGQAASRSMIEDNYGVLGGGCAVARHRAIPGQQSGDERTRAFLRSGAGGQRHSRQCNGTRNRRRGHGKGSMGH